MKPCNYNIPSVNVQLLMLPAGWSTGTGCTNEQHVADPTGVIWDATECRPGSITMKSRVTGEIKTFEFEPHDFNSWADVAQDQAEYWAGKIAEALDNVADAGGLYYYIYDTWDKVETAIDVSIEDADVLEPFDYGPEWDAALYANVKGQIKEMFAELLERDPDEYGEFVRAYFSGQSDPDE